MDHAHSLLSPSAVSTSESRQCLPLTCTYPSAHRLDSHLHSMRPCTCGSDASGFALHIIALHALAKLVML